MRKDSVVRHRNFIFFLLLLLAVGSVFVQLSQYEFISFDDPLYVTENQRVKDGINFQNVVWSLGAIVAANWHPVTLMSHMLDCRLFGVNPGGHHLMNVALHFLNSYFLFLFFKRATDKFYCSAFIGILFAVHPLHVESVAWVSERKDVLSTFFMVLTLNSYLSYRHSGKSWLYYLSLLLFLLGLLAKPMLVTLPFLLLLLDYWPLHRKRDRGDAAFLFSVLTRNRCQLVVEKVPFFLMTATVSVTTLWVQGSQMAVGSTAVFPIQVRVANAIVSYCRYIGQAVWPFNLSLLYPHHGMPDLWKVVAGTVFLSVLAWLCWVNQRKHPYLTVGWFWFVGTLVPVIGFVQVGSQAMADRYTYIPLTGLFIVAVFGADELLRRSGTGDSFCSRIWAIVFMAGLIVILMMNTFVQVGFWRNSMSIFQRSLDTTERNHIMHYMIGEELFEQQRFQDAIRHYRAALEIHPGYLEAMNNLGLAMEALGKKEQAADCYRKVLRIDPNFEKAHINLGKMMSSEGRFQKAHTHYQKALRANPESEEAYNNIGNLYFHQDKMEIAIQYYRKALRGGKGNPTVYRNMAVALYRLGRIEEAVESLKRAIDRAPHLTEARTFLQQILSSPPNFDENGAAVNSGKGTKN